MTSSIDPALAALRADTDALLAVFAASTPDAPEVARRDVATGGGVRARWYEPPDAAAAPAALYVHGGGMIAGSVELYDTLVARYAADSGIRFLSVDYTLAPEARGDALVGAAFEALGLLRAEPGVDPARIAVVGDSGGGGIAAGLAIRARDAGIPLALQLLVYPMLDDRTVDPDPVIAGRETWTWAFNRIAWTAVLGDDRGTDAVPAEVAPARLGDARGLAPAYLEVGELDIFHPEDLAYAALLRGAGVPTELHVHPGVPHGFDRVDPAHPASRRAWAARIRALRSL